MKVFFTLAAALLMCAPIAMAQDTNTQEKTQRDGDKNAAHDGMHAEKEIAAIKLAECRNEIELAKFAQQKSQNAEVKEFAAKMIKDHGEACKELEKWSGDNRAPEGDAAKTTDNEKPGARLEVQGKKGGVVGVDFNAANKAAGAGHFNWVAIHQEMANKCLAAAKKELSEKEGAEFDKCYIGMQIGAHQKMVIADEVLVKYVAAENREKIEKCKATATEHLQAAKTIMKTLDSKSTAEVSRKQ